MAVLETPKIEGLEVLPVSGADEWPAEVELIISALDAGDGAASDTHDNRRRHPRMPYRVIADLQLFSDQPGSAHGGSIPAMSRRTGLGFVTPHRLPLGYGGVVQLPSPAGRPVSVNGTLFRCREVGNGWFEGAPVLQPRAVDLRATGNRIARIARHESLWSEQFSPAPLRESLL